MRLGAVFRRLARSGPTTLSQEDSPIPDAHFVLSSLKAILKHELPTARLCRWELAALCSSCELETRSRDDASYGVTIVPIFTTSKFAFVRRAMVARLSSLQRGSGEPLTYMPLPLSARNSPYFFIAVRITRTSAG